MIRNHKLSSDFDISETFREKIKAKKGQKNTDLDLSKITEIISKKETIAKINYTTDGMHIVFTGDKIYPVNHDELVRIIRESPHLYYSKADNMFLNLKLVRVIEKINNEKVFLYYRENQEDLSVETKFDNLEDAMFFFGSNDSSPINKKDYGFVKGKHFKTKFQKYIRNNLFEKEYKDLIMNNNLSLGSILSASLFYMIPFIPYVQTTKYSISIIPITTILIGLLCFQRALNKRKIIALR